MTRLLPIALTVFLLAGSACDGSSPEVPASAGAETGRDSTSPTLQPTDSPAGIEGAEDPFQGLPRSPGSEEPPAQAAGAGITASTPNSTAGPAPVAPSGEDPVEILLRAEQAYDATRSLRADFVQDLTVPILGSSQRSRGEIFHRKPDRFLMRFSDPRGDVVVADGRYVWLYYPSSDPKQVIRTSMGQAGRLDLQREFLSNPTERFTATLGGADRVDGRPARAITLVPRGASPYKQVRIWVDDQDALVRRFEITESNDAVRRVELHDLRPNVTLDDALFTFTPPAGAEVFDQ